MQIYAQSIPFLHSAMHNNQISDKSNQRQSVRLNLADGSLTFNRKDIGREAVPASFTYNANLHHTNAIRIRVSMDKQDDTSLNNKEYDVPDTDDNTDVTMWMLLGMLILYGNDHNVSQQSKTTCTMGFPQIKV